MTTPSKDDVEVWGQILRYPVGTVLEGWYATLGIQDEYQITLDEWKDEFECEHVETEPRYRDTASARCYYIQCVRCGASQGQVARKHVENPDSALRFDDELRTTWQRTRWATHRAIKAQYQELALEEIAAVRASMDKEQKENYSAYITSAEWKRKRALVLQRDNGLCQGCRINRAVHVHHLTYDHFGDELLYELISVCQSCHEHIHGRPL